MRYDTLHDLAHAHAGDPGPGHRLAGEALCQELHGLFCNEVDCFAYQLELRVFGSIGNATHLATSDADIAVIPTGCRIHPRPSKGPKPEVVCDPLEFRSQLYQYLTRHYGERLVCEQRKAILLCGASGQRIQADIVVLIPRLWQHQICPKCKNPQCSHGYELRSVCEREMSIATWPDQHRDNAAAFDARTSGRYRRAVRAAKALLRCERAVFSAIAPCLPSVLIEHLFAQVSTSVYDGAGACPYQAVRLALQDLNAALQSGRARQFRELSEMRDLFDPNQTWSYFSVRDALARMQHALTTMA